MLIFIYFVLFFFDIWFSNNFQKFVELITSCNSLATTAHDLSLIKRIVNSKSLFKNDVRYI